MSEIETFSEKANRDRILAGVKGGPYFRNPILPPAMHFEDGVAPEVEELMTSGAAESSSDMGEPWAERRPNSTMKK